MVIKRATHYLQLRIIAGSICYPNIYYRAKQKCAINDKNPSAGLPTEGLCSNIQCYFDVTPSQHAVLGGVDVQMLLCILLREREFSKFVRFGNYFLPWLIAACPTRYIGE